LLSGFSRKLSGGIATLGALRSTSLNSAQLPSALNPLQLCQEALKDQGKIKPPSYGPRCQVFTLPANY